MRWSRAQWLFRIIRVTVCCNDRGSNLLSGGNLLFGSFFLLEGGKEAARSTRLAFTTGIKGRPPDKGRRLFAARVTCNPSSFCDLSQDGASRTNGIGRQTRWLDTFHRLMFLIKKSPFHKARERSPFWSVKGIFELLFPKGTSQARCAGPAWTWTYSVARKTNYEMEVTLFRVIWKLPEERKSRYSSSRVVFYLGDKSLRGEYFSESTEGRFAVLEQFSYIHVIRAISKTQHE